MSWPWNDITIHSTCLAILHYKLFMIARTEQQCHCGGRRNHRGWMSRHHHHRVARQAKQKKERERLVQGRTEIVTPTQSGSDTKLTPLGAYSWAAAFAGIHEHLKYRLAKFNPQHLFSYIPHEKKNKYAYFSCSGHRDFSTDEFPRSHSPKPHHRHAHSFNKKATGSVSCFMLRRTDEEGFGPAKTVSSR